MQGLDLVHAVDKIIEWSEHVDKQLKAIESELLSLQQQIWQNTKR
jgi:hypothetical protein